MTKDTYQSPTDYVLVSDCTVAIPNGFIFAYRAKGGDIYVHPGIDVAKFIAWIKAR